MCLCVAFTQLSLYSSIWDASVGLIIGSGAPIWPYALCQREPKVPGLYKKHTATPNGVKCDISPDKITKSVKSYSLRQEFKCICIHFICRFSSH